MAQTKAQLVVGLNVNASAPASALQIDASGNVNLDSNTLFVDATNNRVGIGTSTVNAPLHLGTASGRAILLNNSTIGTTSGDGTYLTNNTDGSFAIINQENGSFTLGTNNADRLTITGGGLVGIGSATPGDFNQVVNAPHLVIGNGTTSSPGVTLYSTTAGAGIVAFADGTTGNQQYRGYIQYDQNVDQLNLGSNGPITFNTGTERARIDSSGRLLVGTSSARGNFFNASTAFPQLQIEGTNGNTCSLVSVSSAADTDGGRLLLAHQRSGSIGGNTILNNGDEIGRITFQGSDGSEFVNAVQITAEVDGAPGANDMPGRLVFSTTADGTSSPTERGRFTSVGYLKCANSGTYLNSSGAYHEFNNNAADHTMRQRNTNGSDPYGLRIDYTNDPNNTGSEFLYCASATSTLRASIRSNGGLANFSANNANLSDRNVKKDISPAAATWDCIKEWEIVNYRYKDQPDDADLNFGVIAQQVAESCPEVITVFSEAKDAKPAVLDDDGNEVEPAQEAQPEKLGVKEQQMYWMAIKALQEAQVRIEALEAEVAALKAQ